MWSRSRIKPLRARVGVTLALVVTAGTILAGCSDIYFDRRETIALSADDAGATDRVAQMIDPWPRDVGRRNIAFNGEKMQTAVERYRTGKTQPPVNVTTSSAAYQAAEQAAAASVTPSGSATPAAPVK
ncbi:MAG TPA: hypothetical protein VG291_04505 [Xanthobacteraceae bacterium]|jgi:hypothetical protein|nr:hypothetical protein [Xanthobacteraceae bacterium]